VTTPSVHINEGPKRRLVKPNFFECDLNVNRSQASQEATMGERDSLRKTAAQFEEFARDTEVPQAMRDLAERNIAQMRETYERSKDALEGVMESWERSFDAAGQGAVALNRKIIDIAQRNINSSFDLAKNLAGAKNLAEAVEMQSSYWRNQLDTLAAQADEVRTLSTQVAANAAKPMERGMEELKKAR
jgi:phasin